MRRTGFPSREFSRFWLSETVSALGTYVTLLSLEALVVLTMSGSARLRVREPEPPASALPHLRREISTGVGAGSMGLQASRYWPSPLHVWFAANAISGRCWLPMRLIDLQLSLFQFGVITSCAGAEKPRLTRAGTARGEGASTITAAVDQSVHSKLRSGKTRAGPPGHTTRGTSAIAVGW
ncbi:MAG: hypothetical protein WKF73_05320 [Nocardioidaceae bacterium]